MFGGAPPTPTRARHSKVLESWNSKRQQYRERRVDGFSSAQGKIGVLILNALAFGSSVVCWANPNPIWGRLYVGVAPFPHGADSSSSS